MDGLKPVGEKLLPYAEQILKLASEARELVSGSAVPRGTLSVGAAETICIYRLPPLLQEYSKRFPEVGLTLVNGNLDDLIRRLKGNEIDVAFFMGQEIANPDMISETLLDEPMVLVSAAGHPLIKKAPVTPVDIQGETMVLCGCCYRGTLEKIFGISGLQAGTILKFASVETRKRCVINGLGITLLPRITVEAELAQGTLVDLAGTVLTLSSPPRLPTTRTSGFHRPCTSSWNWPGRCYKISNAGQISFHQGFTRML